jgi:hypothetical protein
MDQKYLRPAEMPKIGIAIAGPADFRRVDSMTVAGTCAQAIGGIAARHSSTPALLGQPTRVTALPAGPGPASARGQYGQDARPAGAAVYGGPAGLGLSVRYTDRMT